MKRLYVLLLSLFVMALFAACGGGGDVVVEETPTPIPTATPTPIPAPEPETPVEPEPEESAGVALLEGPNWSMEIADGWDDLDGLIPSSLFSPCGSGSNITVGSESLYGESLEQILIEIIDMYEMMFADFELIAYEFLVINGKDALLIVFEAPSVGIHIMYQFVIEHNDVAFIVTYLQVDETDYIEDVRGMVDTFTVRD